MTVMEELWVASIRLVAKPQAFAARDWVAFSGKSSQDQGSTMLPWFGKHLP